MMNEEDDMYESGMTRREVIFGCSIATAVLLPVFLLMMYFN